MDSNIFLRNLQIIIENNQKYHNILLDKDESVSKLAI